MNGAVRLCGLSHQVLGAGILFMSGGMQWLQGHSRSSQFDSQVGAGEWPQMHTVSPRLAHGEAVTPSDTKAYSGWTPEVQRVQESVDEWVYLVGVGCREALSFCPKTTFTLVNGVMYNYMREPQWGVHGD